VDAGSVGNFNLPYETKARRLTQALCFLKSDDPEDNGYARPIDGLIPLVDVNNLKIVRIFFSLHLFFFFLTNNI